MDTRRGNQGGSYITEANRRDAAVVARMSASELQLTGQLIEARNQRDLAIDRMDIANSRLLSIADDARFIQISLAHENALPKNRSSDMTYLIALINKHAAGLRAVIAKADGLKS